MSQWQEDPICPILREGWFFPNFNDPLTEISNSYPRKPRAMCGIETLSTITCHILSSKCTFHPLKHSARLLLRSWILNCIGPCHLHIFCCRSIYHVIHHSFKKSCPHILNLCSPWKGWYWDRDRHPTSICSLTPAKKRRNSNIDSI